VPYWRLRERKVLELVTERKYAVYFLSKFHADRTICKILNVDKMTLIKYRDCIRLAIVESRKNEIPIQRIMKALKGGIYVTN
jgi:hypothetical protein